MPQDGFPWKQILKCSLLRGDFLSSVLWKEVKRSKTGQTKWSCEVGSDSHGWLHGEAFVGLRLPGLYIPISISHWNASTLRRPWPGAEWLSAARASPEGAIERCLWIELSASGAINSSLKGNLDGAWECPSHMIIWRLQRSNTCPGPRKNILEIH